MSVCNSFIEAHHGLVGDGKFFNVKAEFRCPLWSREMPDMQLISILTASILSEPSFNAREGMVV